jgi:hypothetical protein
MILCWETRELDPTPKISSIFLLLQKGWTLSEASGKWDHPNAIGSTLSSTLNCILALEMG